MVAGCGPKQRASGTTTNNARTQHLLNANIVLFDQASHIWVFTYIRYTRFTVRQLNYYHFDINERKQAHT